MYKNENPPLSDGPSGKVDLGGSEFFQTTPSALSMQCRKQLYMSLFHGGVIDEATLSWAFAANPDWRQA